MKNSKILIIGAGGQLGSELTLALWNRYGQGQVIATDVKDPGGMISQGNFDLLDVLNQNSSAILFEKIASLRYTIWPQCCQLQGRKNQSLPGI